MQNACLLIAKMIDHSLLNPILTTGDLESGCEIAIKYQVASICILPYFLKRCVGIVEGSSVKAGTTIGFPHGGHTTSTKVFETKQALKDGAEELDMVVNISKVISEDWAYVQGEINAVLDIVHTNNKKLKVIFENAYLNRHQKIKLCEICGELGVDWVKTSTGYGPGGATDDDLILMREHSPPSIQIKAAGGIRTYKRLLEVKALGVTRVGASQTAAIMKECQSALKTDPKDKNHK